MSAQDVHVQILIGGAGRSSSPDVCWDIRPKTSSLGWFSFLISLHLYVDFAEQNTSAQSVSCIQFSENTSGHGCLCLRVKDVRAKIWFSCAPSDGVRAFGPGRPPGYPPGRPRDIPPKNFTFRLLFGSWRKGLCRNLRRFFRAHVPVSFGEDFFCGFFGPFLWISEQSEKSQCKTEKSRMHRRADFWSNFWEVPGVLKQTSKKLPRNALRLLIST